MIVHGSHSFWDLDQLARLICGLRGHVVRFDCGGNYCGCKCGEVQVAIVRVKR